MVAFDSLKVFLPPVGVAAAVFWGTFLAWREAKEEDYDLEKFFDCFLAATFFAVVIGRLVVLLGKVNSFAPLGLAFFDFHKYPEFSIESALVGGVATLAVFCRFLKLNFWQMTDLLVVGLATIQFLVVASLFLSQAPKFSLSLSYHVIGALAIMLIAIRVRKRIHFAGFASLWLISLQALMVLTLAGLGSDSVYFNLKAGRAFWLAVLILSTVLLYKKAKRRLGEDWQNTVKFGLETAANLVYFIQSRRGRRRLGVKLMNWVQARRLAFSTYWQTRIRIVKGVLDGKRFKKA